MRRRPYTGVYGFIAAGRSYFVPTFLNMTPAHVPTDLLGEVITGVMRSGEEYGQNVRQRLRDKYFLIDHYAATSRRNPIPGQGELSTPQQPLPRLSVYEDFVQSHLHLDRGGSYVLEAARNRGVAESIQHLARDCHPPKTGLSSMLAQSVVTLVRPELVASTCAVFVVDLDNDAVALLLNVRDKHGNARGGKVESCASLSSVKEMQDMLTEISEAWDWHTDTTASDQPIAPSSEQESARWRQAVCRFQRLGGCLRRSFDSARCAANLGLPEGWPVLVDQDEYPTDEDLSLLEARHQFPDERAPWMMEEQRLAAEGRSDVSADTLDDLTAGLDSLDTTANTDVSPEKPNTKSVTKSALTAQQREAIMFLKEQRRYPNKWIAEQVGVKEWRVAELTKGMPGVNPYNRQRRTGFGF